MSRIDLQRVSGRNPILVIVTATFVALSLSAVPAAADELPPTNLELMNDISSQAIAELLDRFSSQLSGHSVVLKPFAVNEQYQFLTNVFTAALTDRGIKTFPPGASRAEDPMPGNDVVLQYQATTFNLTYPKVYRSHLIGGKRVRRRAEVTLLATLVDNRDGSVAGVAEAGREYQDQFDHDDVGLMEEGNYQFTRPPVPSSGWGRYAEPVLVTGIVVGLIYLFFSNQSDN
jgi:hypothetical protein